jgi:ribosomal protein S18 acetylase RimI-like enzyme
VGLATGDADVAGAATLHAGQISEGFLSFLGTPFLRRLYRRITRSSTSFLLVARQDGDLAGFVAGSTDVAGLYRSFLVHDGLPAAAGVIRRLLPAWRRVIETVRHGSAKGPGRGRGPELLAIAVEPGHLGRGVGRSLVASFLDEVVDRGYDAAFVVVGADNAPAVGLYERAGFQTVGQFELHPGTDSRLMQWDRPERVGPH